MQPWRIVRQCQTSIFFQSSFNLLSIFFRSSFDLLLTSFDFVRLRSTSFDFVRLLSIFFQSSFNLLSIFFQSSFDQNNKAETECIECALGELYASNATMENCTSMQPSRPNMSQFCRIFSPEKASLFNPTTEPPLQQTKNRPRQLANPPPRPRTTNHDPRPTHPNPQHVPATKKIFRYVSHHHHPTPPVRPRRTTGRLTHTFRQDDWTTDHGFGPTPNTSPTTMAPHGPVSQIPSTHHCIGVHQFHHHHHNGPLDFLFGQAIFMVLLKNCLDQFAQVSNHQKTTQTSDRSFSGV